MFGNNGGMYLKQQQKHLTGANADIHSVGLHLQKTLSQHPRTFTDVTCLEMYHNWCCFFLSVLIWVTVAVQVWPLPEVAAGLEWTGRQIQQHGRTSRLRREGGLRPGHQVLLQRPRRQGIPHVSNLHPPHPTPRFYTWTAAAGMKQTAWKPAIASLLIDRAVTHWPALCQVPHLRPL